MLERTPACIEPVSQLFLRCLEPPVRSQRVLGPLFWKNGGNQLDVPPWWPLYLKRGRASSQREAALESSSPGPQPSWLEPSNKSPTLRSRGSRRARRSALPSPSTAIRNYTRSTATAQKADTALSVEDVGLLHLEDSPRQWSTVRNQHVRLSPPLGKTEQGILLPVSSVALEQTERQLQEILQRTQTAKSAPANAELNRAWSLFNQIPNQRVFATDIFRILARFGGHLGQARALNAFNLLEENEITRDDFEMAVRTALKADDYRLALRINKTATVRNLQQGCSVFFLLHAVSNQLWNAAAAVWTTSFKRQPLGFNQTSPTRIALTEEIGKHRDIPPAIHQLGSKLRERAPVIMQRSGILQLLFHELLAALVRNGQLMSIITPQGLHNLLGIAYDLRRAIPSMYVSAIRTINQSVTRSDKGPLADLVYTSLRSDLPEWPPAPSTFGSLISIHAELASPAQKLNHYLDEFAKFHGTADQMSFQKVMSALASQGDIDGVQKVFLRLYQSHGPPTNPRYYTPLMYAYARLGDVSATEREMRRMTDAGVVPHSYAWNILIYAHARSSQPEKAIASKVLALMKTNGVKPDSYTYTTLMSISARRGDTASVLDILERAQQDEVKGSYELLTGLVQSYCLNDQAEAAEKVAKAATTARFQGYATIMWNYLLRHYAFLADSQSMLRVQQQMTALGVKSDGMTHAAFMTALVVLGKTRDAVKILRRLNLSQTVEATPFHYAILLHGFAKEGDRDTTNVIYQEMVERFPRLGISPRLAMLHLQASRNNKENERPKFAEKYFEEILHSLSTRDRAERLPQPGLHGERNIDVVPALYVEYFVDLLVKKGQVKRADKLLRRLESLDKSPYMHLSTTESTSISYLTTKMMLRAAKEEWEEVDLIWEQILERGVQISEHSSANEEQRSFQSTVDDGNTDIPHALGPSPTRPVGLPGIEMRTNEFTFSSMIQTAAASHSPLDRPGLKILFSQRFILEKTLNRYLDTLAVRQSQDSASALVGKLEKVGFSMSSKNWNGYLQVLTRSPEPAHWILAYRIFEEKMIPSIPPWPLLISGKWLPPPDLEGRVSPPVDRKSVERRNPEQIMSTYYTAVHLASVLLKAARLVAEGDKSTENALRKLAPITCRYIRHIPFRKDRIQGTLLRGRSFRLLVPRPPRFAQEPDRSGVLGSHSPVDHVPAEERVGLKDVLEKEASTKASNEVVKSRTVRRAELYQGQIARAPILRAKRRALETRQEFTRRVQFREGKAIRMLRVMRRDVLAPRAVSDMYFGHPAVPTTVGAIRSSKNIGSTLYGTEYEGLVKQAHQGKRLRAERRAALRRIPPPPAKRERPLAQKQKPVTGSIMRAGNSLVASGPSILKQSRIRRVVDRSLAKRSKNTLTSR